MTLTTAETFTVDGVALNTYAKNIESRTGRMHVPGLRTPNAAPPSRHGELWTKYKVYEPGTASLSMWVLGCDDSGVVPGGSTARKEFIKNRDALIQLLTAQQSLRLLQQTMPDGSVRQAYGEVLAAIDFSAFNPTDARFGVDFNLPYTFWEDATLQTDVAIALASEGVNGGAVTAVPTWDGSNAPIEDLIIKIKGPAVNPKLIDVWSGHYFQWTGSLLSTDTLVVDSSAWTAVVGATNVIANLAVVGDSPRLFVLHPRQAASPQLQLVSNGSWSAGTSSLKLTGRRKYMVA
jgi:hypothetical protein